ncbi:MAG: serine hydrolase, partial [Flavobacteriales bacterium]|nr:serine hydrolase [Flavobacteriales bacterium]
ACSGKLPVTVSEAYPFGHGLESKRVSLLRNVMPEQIGVKSEVLFGIDSIVFEGIAAQAFPGCRVLAVQGGNVFFDKSYGHQTYEEKDLVHENTIYDIASITKVAASTLSLMRLQDEGKLNVDYNLCDYLDICDTSDYFNMNLTEMLSHHARLKSWIPFYLRTLDGGKINEKIYSRKARAGYTTKVANSLYINDNYVDSIYNRILDTDLRRKREYKYSDLGYYFVQDIIEKISGMPLEEYVDSTFYRALNLNTITYLPLEKHSKRDIAPTEYDMMFRKQLVHGHVHDPGAAMMGGVGGHAGLFSNARDLAVLMQMFVNDGEYGGQRIIQEETLDYFTQCHFCDEDNRRGIGFDKPTKDLDRGPTCNSASLDSFGHSGFTGTLVWADPEHDIVYVFLSNRVYPNSDNRKLLKMDIRTRIQQVIYDAFEIPARGNSDDVVNN